MRTRQLLLILAFLIASSSFCFAGEVKINLPKHVLGQQEISIVLESMDAELAGGTITITYRPGSKVEKTILLAAPPINRNRKAGIDWIPSEPGIARIDYQSHLKSSPDEVIKASKMVGILFPESPLSGILVMCLAAFILFGGCFVSLNLLIKSNKNRQ